MLLALLLFSLSLALYRRLLRYLRYLQQEDYTPYRFLKWICQNYCFDTRFSLIALGGYLCTLQFPSLALLLGSLASVTLSLLEDDPRRSGKITLKMTARAKRIFSLSVCFTFSITLSLFWFFSTSPWLCFFIAMQIVPFALVAATWVLSYEEAKRQKTLMKEARDLLLADSPHIIGITGSYGKTSAKNLLGPILQVTLGPTFWPSKGVNTLMGSTREIRQRWQKGYSYSVMEMGAYYKGSIKKLCEFTPPSSAWITSIGLAHLERFKTQDTILHTKAELADALAPGSLLVLNGDNLGCRQISKWHSNKKTVLYGLNNDQNDLDVWLHNYIFSEKGSVFEITYNGKSYQGSSLMVGKTALSNVAGAFAMACHLGADPEFALAVIAQIPPIGNRLQIEKVGAITYLHDAYNSNPIGFNSALEVLAQLPAKRRLLMTPGMIELGSEQDRLNEEAGKAAASICDLVFIVGSHNREALKKGLLSAGMPSEHIYICENRDEAFCKWKQIQQSEDSLLIENDLSDLHEQLPRF